VPWLIAAVFLLAYEGYALATGRRTLSRMVRNGQEKFPALGFLVGFGAGLLGSHFFWIWCP
jgi:hypothetical protein